MSIASQQRVIEEHQATIRELRRELAQAKANERDALYVYEAMTELCDQTVRAGLTVIPVTNLRRIRPKGHGV